VKPQKIGKYKKTKNKNKNEKQKPKTKTKQEQKTNKTKTTWCNIMISERNKHILTFAWQLLCNVIIRGKSCNEVLIESEDFKEVISNPEG
jgi:hypothetical protein